MEGRRGSSIEERKKKGKRKGHRKGRRKEEQ